MGHRKYDNPKQAEPGFVKARPQGVVIRARPRPPEFTTPEAILHRGGIVAGPYGTKGFEHRHGPTRGPERSDSSRKIISSKVSTKLAARNPINRQPITISHREDAHGAGAFWDHYTVRTTTGRSTDITHHRKVAPTLEAPGEKTGGRYKGALPGGRPASGTHPGQGLLFIAGGNYGLDSETPRNREHIATGGSVKRHGRRVSHEQDLLKQAQLTGRPVLGICGGSWRVLESYGGSTRGVKPKTHQTRVMPYLTTKGVVAKVASEHDVQVQPGTMLSSVFKDDHQHTPDKVNSAHWAVAEEQNPGRLKGVTRVGPRRMPLLTVSARGGTSNDPPYLNQPGKVSRQSVEAFESRHGAPVMGIQWHPEAYGSGFPASQTQANKRLLTWMAKAGDAYEARRDMTAEFGRWAGMKRLQPAYLARNRAFQVARRNAKL